jgi:hypothetical protein
MLEIALTPKELAGLDRFVQAPLSPVSPLGRGSPLDGAELASLGQRGWFDAGGRLEPTLGRALEALATSRAATQISLAVGNRVFEHVVTFASDGSRRVSLSTVPDGLVLRDPAPVDTLLAGVQEYVGASVLRAVPFEAELDVASGVLLAALLDMQRRATLRARAESSPPTPAAVDPRALADVATRAPEGWYWLVSILRMALGDAMPSLDEATVTRSLFLLERMGHVQSSVQGVVLSTPPFALASRLLAIDVLLRVRAVRLAETGVVQATSFVSLHAGVQDVLLVDAAGGAVRFLATAAAAVLESVRLLVTDPDALGPVASPAPRTRQPMGTAVL